MALHARSFRLLACALVVVLAITFAAPARAEADVMTSIAIGSLLVAGIVVIAYLIIANVDESRRAESPRIVWLACADCAVAPTGGGGSAGGMGAAAGFAPDSALAMPAPEPPQTR